MKLGIASPDIREVLEIDLELILGAVVGSFKDQACRVLAFWILWVGSRGGASSPGAERQGNLQVQRFSLARKAGQNQVMACLEHGYGKVSGQTGTPGRSRAFISLVCAQLRTKSPKRHSRGTFQTHFAMPVDNRAFFEWNARNVTYVLARPISRKVRFLSHEQRRSPFAINLAPAMRSMLIARLRKVAIT